MGALVWRRDDAAKAGTSAAAATAAQNSVPGHEIASEAQLELPPQHPTNSHDPAAPWPPRKRPAITPPAHARPLQHPPASQQQWQQPQHPHASHYQHPYPHPHHGTQPAPHPRRVAPAVPNAVPTAHAVQPPANAAASHGLPGAPVVVRATGTADMAGAPGCGAHPFSGRPLKRPRSDDPQHHHGPEHTNGGAPSATNGHPLPFATPGGGPAARAAGAAAGGRAAAPPKLAQGPPGPPASGLGAGRGSAGSGPGRSAGAGGPAAGPGSGPGSAPTAAARLRETEAAVEALRRQVAAREAAVRAKKAEQEARQAAEHAKKAALQAEAEQRRAQLARGLAALAEAAGPEDGGATGERGQPIRVAGPEEVARVLGAASDYQVLELTVGCTAAEVRRAYRRLAASLHPDKCGAEGAQEAFIRATGAYNALVKRSGG